MQHFPCVEPLFADGLAAASCCRYEMGRQPANTKLSTHVAVRKVRVRGGNSKFRALRLDHGTYSWGSEVRGMLLQAGLPMLCPCLHA